MNPFYEDKTKWNPLAIHEKLEWIRQHLCTGLCGATVIQQDINRINEALTEAVKLFSVSEGSHKESEDNKARVMAHFGTLKDEKDKEGHLETLRKIRKES